jgi:hypothetical protein
MVGSGVGEAVDGSGVGACEGPREGADVEGICDGGGVGTRLGTADGGRVIKTVATDADTTLIPSEEATDELVSSDSMSVSHVQPLLSPVSDKGPSIEKLTAQVILAEESRLRLRRELAIDASTENPRSQLSEILRLSAMAVFRFLCCACEGYTDARYSMDTTIVVVSAVVGA